VGGELEMRLPTDPKPAFMWRIELPDDLLAIVAQSFDPAACPPVYHVRLQARGAGEATVRCSYRRPWDNEPAEIRTYLVAIQPR
jgi:predicted secreted protein